MAVDPVPPLTATHLRDLAKAEAKSAELVAKIERARAAGLPVDEAEQIRQQWHERIKNLQAQYSVERGRR